MVTEDAINYFGKGQLKATDIQPSGKDPYQGNLTNVGFPFFVRDDRKILFRGITMPAADAVLILAKELKPGKGDLLSSDIAVGIGRNQRAGVHSLFGYKDISLIRQ